MFSKYIGAALITGGAAFSAMTGCETRTVVVERPHHPAPRVIYAPPPEREVIVVQQPAPPPPPAREVVVVSPGPEYIWIAGCHEWVGGRWTWVPGRWERPAHHGAVWVRGDWHHEPHGYRWERGHWR
jgi:hypothetical protein